MVNDVLVLLSIQRNGEVNKNCCVKLVEICILELSEEEARYPWDNFFIPKLQ